MVVVLVLINTAMNQKEALAKWVRDKLGDSNGRNIALTMRVDGSVTNGAAIRQGVWSQSAVNPSGAKNKALDWTITELKRKHPMMKFIPFLGGDRESGVQGHIHGLLHLPNDIDPQEFRDKMERIWTRNIRKCLKDKGLSCSIGYLEEIKDIDAYLAYCQRFEGSTFESGLEKVVVSASLCL